LFLLAAFIIDVRHYVIPNSVNVTLLSVSIIWIGIGLYVGAFSDIYRASFLRQFSAIFPSFQSIVVNHIFGAVVALLFFLAIFIFSGGRAMGMGDVKLIGALGLLFGWPDIVPIILLSFIIGAAVSVFLIASGKKKMTDKVSFGPFIVIATAIIFFFGAGLLSAYFGIIGL
jgi:leader peptidase (prepilin peptidase)/N-methyltransferase